MIGHCQDCKHWDDFIKGRGACLNPKVQGWSEEIKADEAGLDDTATSLSTGPHFGCVQFEDKP